MWFGRHARAIVDYVAHHREALAAMPSFLCVIGAGRAAGLGLMRRGLDLPAARIHRLVPPRWHVRRLVGPMSWHTRHVHQLALTIADALPARDPR